MDSDIDDRNRAAALFFLRALLGLIFFMTGFAKVCTWGVETVYSDHFAPFESTFLPVAVIRLTAYYTSYVELFGGLLLLIGAKRDWCLFALGSVLLIVSFGHGIASPIRDLSAVVFRAGLLVPLLMFPASWDRWQLEKFLDRRADSSSPATDGS